MDELPYTPFYCEENIWHLAGHRSLAKLERRVVLMTNRARSCLLMNQRAAAPGRPVFWDYHVILVAAEATAPRWRVFDLDTRLGLGVDLEAYVEQTFPRDLPPELRATLRVLNADDFTARFSSDRAHMRTGDGGWVAPPPEWPPIAPETVDPGWTLAALLDLSRPSPGEEVAPEGLAGALGHRR